MKKYLLIAFAAGSLLTASAPGLYAATDHKMTQAEMIEMCKSMGTEDCRAMMREMVKRKDLHKVMAEELKKDKDFNQTYGNLTTGGG